MCAHWRSYAQTERGKWNSFRSFHAHTYDCSQKVQTPRRKFRSRYPHWRLREHTLPEDYLFPLHSMLPAEARLRNTASVCTCVDQRRNIRRLAVDNPHYKTVLGPAKTLRQLPSIVERVACQVFKNDTVSGRYGWIGKGQKTA